MRRLSFPVPAGLVLACAVAPLAPAPALAASAAPTATAAQAAATPKPAVPIATFAKRLERALTKRRCPGLKAINRYGQIRLPCPSSSRRFTRAFRGFKVRGTRTYGSGAVIDFTDAEAPRGGTYVLALSARRRWSIVFAPKTNRRTSKDAGPGDLAGHQNALANFLPAVRDGDCDAYFRFAVTPPGEPKTRSCAAAFGANGLYTGLQEDLRATPDAAPVALGGNRTFAFFALRTGSTYRTAVTMRTAPGSSEPFLVLTTERV